MSTTNTGEESTMVPYDYTIVTDVGPLTPEGFIAVDRCDEQGEVIDRVLDIYGHGEAEIALAEHIVQELTCQLAHSEEEGA